MYYVLYQVYKNDPLIYKGILPKNKYVWGDCDLSHDYGVAVEFFESEQKAYIFLVHKLPYCSDLGPFNDDGLNEEITNNYDKFKDIWDIKHLQDQLEKIDLQSLKDFYDAMNFDKGGFFQSQYLGIAIGKVE